MWPASARSARLLAAIPPTTSTARIARERTRTAASRPRWAAAAEPRSCATRDLRDVGRCAEDEISEMVVDEPVVDDPPDLAPVHRTTFTEESELVGQGRDAHSEDEGDVADAQLFGTDRQEMDDPRARRVGERREQVADSPGAVRAEGSPQQRADGLRVEALDGAGVCVDLGGACSQLAFRRRLSFLGATRARSRRGGESGPLARKIRNRGIRAPLDDARAGPTMERRATCIGRRKRQDPR